MNTAPIGMAFAALLPSACAADRTRPANPPAGSGGPAVGSESDPTAFQDARAGQAEKGIRRLGYEPVRSKGLTTCWFNRNTGAFARIGAAQGLYSSATMHPAGDC